MDAMKDFGEGRIANDGAAETSPDSAAEQAAVAPSTMPSGIDHDERRMQVRAYNYWAGLLDGRSFPSVEELVPEHDTDFGPYSVLLDFTEGVEKPGIAFLGEKLAEQCGVARDIVRLEQVPPRSLLTRLTDHYLQIFANQAPIGFEAEFVDQHGATILYRGIMLPFSSDDETIDFIYGVINWKVSGAGDEPDFMPAARLPFNLDLAGADNDEDEDDVDFGVVQPLFAREAIAFPEGAAPADFSLSPPDAEWSDADGPDAGGSGTGARVAEEMELADWLAEARECADAAKSSEDRSRKALYQAIGRAYDFSLAAAEAPEDYGELICDAGLVMQERAPLTPLVKLVFGADYDKTRLTEYATALGHAHRLGLERGTFARFLSEAEGGLKGVVAMERGLRREENGKSAQVGDALRPALAGKLRDLPPQSFDALPPQGDEFALVLARRLPSGEVVMLGEVPRDLPLLERAARKLLG